ncbi:MAG: hypothetical protein Ct9H300mP18_00080 [Candidatus Neomarinimicrobiota bacterium]|nr:MAG: hypothetical protein Ct9H300mP18_00080 [Candidatus Neomarinimicrobiota bacterium]
MLKSIKSIPKWFLLRGSIEDITKMAQLGFFAIAAVDNHDQSELIHTENVILVDQNGKKEESIMEHHQ